VIERYLSEETWSLGQAPAEGLKKVLVALLALRSSGRLGLLRQRGRCDQPKADEKGKGLGANPDIAFQPFHLPRDTDPCIAGIIVSCSAYHRIYDCHHMRKNAPFVVRHCRP
jgi:hypothetical protein